MQKGTHPGPPGHPSEEGSHPHPSLEGCRESGGVGSPWSGDPHSRRVRIPGKVHHTLREGWGEGHG